MERISVCRYSTPNHPKRHPHNADQRVHHSHGSPTVTKPICDPLHAPQNPSWKKNITPIQFNDFGLLSTVSPINGAGQLPFPWFEPRKPGTRTLPVILTTNRLGCLTAQPTRIHGIMNWISRTAHQPHQPVVEVNQVSYHHQPIIIRTPIHQQWFRW